jgi:hypothetical protein
MRSQSVAWRPTPDVETVRRATDWESSGKGVCPICHKRKLSINSGRDKEVVVWCWGCGEQGQLAICNALGLSGGGGQTIARTERKQTVSPAYDEYCRFRDALAICRRASGYRGFRDGRYACEPVEQPTAYFKARGIAKCPPSAMIIPAREAKRLFSIRPDREGRRLLPKNAPVMVLPIVGKDGLQAAHTTVLSLQGTGKLNDNARRIHGIKKGGYIALSTHDPNGPLIVGEGVETTASAMEIADLPGVAAIDAGNFASVVLPACAELIVARDCDKVGREAAERLAQRYAAQIPARIAVPPKGYGDWNDAHQAALRGDLDLAELKRTIIKAPRVKVPEFTGVVSMVDLMAMDIPPMMYCLRPILLKPGRTMLSARAGHFKTRLSLSIAYAKATGTALMDWTADEPGRVLYIDAELGAENIKAWWQRLGPSCPNLFLLSDKLNFRSKQPRVTLATEDGRRYLAEKVEEVDPELIVLDSLFTLAPPDMSADRVGESAWPKVRQWIDEQVLAGRHVLLLHHNSKGGQQYGSVLKETELDCLMQLEKEPQFDAAGRFAAKLSFNKPRHLSVEEQLPRIISINTDGDIEWRREDAQHVGPGRPALNLAAHKIRRVQGDRYAGEWPREQFAKRGVKYEPADKTASQLFLELLPLINARRVGLLDHRPLLDQLINLERRTSFGTRRDTFGNPPGCHDDLAVACAGAALLATTKRARIRVGYCPAGVGRVHWQEDEEPRQHIRFITLTEQEDLKRRGLL